MDAFFNNISHRKTRISLLATYALTRYSLQSILATERQLSLTDTAENGAELIEKISRSKPDVILICLVENEGDNIDFIADLIEIAPQAKIILLTSPNFLSNQTAASKLGVAAVIEADQTPRTLLRAIRQISAGESWLNEKVIAQFVDTEFGAPASSGTKNKRYFRSDELTDRELEVIRMIGLGLNNRDISKKLHISEPTVRCHLSSIYSKLNVEDRLNLAIYAYRRRLVLPTAGVV